MNSLLNNIIRKETTKIITVIPNCKARRICYTLRTAPVTCYRYDKGATSGPRAVGWYHLPRVMNQVYYEPRAKRQSTVKFRRLVETNSEENRVHTTKTRVKQGWQRSVLWQWNSGLRTFCSVSLVLRHANNRIPVCLYCVRQSHDAKSYDTLRESTAHAHCYVTHAPSLRCNHLMGDGRCSISVCTHFNSVFWGQYVN